MLYLFRLQLLRNFSFWINQQIKHSYEKITFEENAKAKGMEKQCLAISEIMGLMCFQSSILCSRCCSFLVVSSFPKLLSNKCSLHDCLSFICIRFLSKVLVFFPSCLFTLFPYHFLLPATVASLIIII